MEAGGCHRVDALGRAQQQTLDRNDRRTMTTIREAHRRVAYCECGARLVGDSSEELFAAAEPAAERHVAHHHPQLLGALGLDVVAQMAEDVGG